MANDNEAASASQKVEQVCVNIKEALHFLQQGESLHLELEFDNYDIVSSE
jgi:hypothetical protein